VNDKQLFKMCLNYVKALKQPVTRQELIKLLEERVHAVNISPERVQKTEENEHD
jgi:hypothetical protein